MPFIRRPLTSRWLTFALLALVAILSLSGFVHAGNPAFTGVAKGKPLDYSYQKVVFDRYSPVEAQAVITITPSSDVVLSPEFFSGYVMEYNRKTKGAPVNKTLTQNFQYFLLSTWSSNDTIDVPYSISENVNYTSVDNSTFQLTVLSATQGRMVHNATTFTRTFTDYRPVSDFYGETRKAGVPLTVKIKAVNLDWSTNYDFVPTIFGTSHPEDAFLNTSALARYTFNLTSPANGNGANNTLHFTISNYTMNSTYCTSAANTSLTFTNASGEYALYGSSSYGAFWEQFMYANAQNLSRRDSSLWIRVADLPAAANATSFQVYCGTNGGTEQFNSTVVFQDLDVAQLFEQDAGGVTYGFNSNQNHPNAVSSVVGTVLNRNYSVGNQAQYNCDAVGCSNQYYTNFTLTPNSTADITIMQLDHELLSGAGSEYYFYDAFVGGSGGYFYGHANIGASPQISCETYDGTTRVAGNTSAFANDTAFSIGCMLNVSNGAGGAITQFKDGVQQQSVLANALAGGGNSFRTGGPAAQSGWFGAIHSALVRWTSPPKYMLSESWVKPVHNTAVTSTTVDFIGDVTAPTLSTVMVFGNGTAYSQGQYLSLNASDFDAVGVTTKIFNLDGANTSVATSVNTSTTKLAAGSHTFYVFASDAAGNKVQSATYSFSISQATPTLTLHINSTATNQTAAAPATWNVTVVSLTTSYAMNVVLSLNGTGLYSQSTFPITNTTTYVGARTDLWTANTTGDTNYTAVGVTLTDTTTPVVPVYTSNASALTNGTTWSSGLYVSFNSSWYAPDGVSAILYEVDGVNATNTTTNGNFSTTTLAAGYHTWKACANSTSNLANCTGLYGFSLAQESSNITLYLDSAYNNKTVAAANPINVTVLSINTSYAVTVTLYRNGTSVSSSSSLPIYTSTTATGTSYNFTACFAGDTNFTSSCVGFIATYQDLVPVGGSGGGGGGGSNPVKPGDVVTYVLDANGNVVSAQTSAGTDYVATFRLWVRHDTLLGDWLVPNWIIAFLIVAVGVAYGTRKKQGEKDSELTPLGAVSVAFGLLAAFAYFI